MSSQEFVTILAYLALSVTLMLSGIEYWQMRSYTGHKWQAARTILLSCFFFLLAASLVLLNYYGSALWLRTFNRHLVWVASITSIVLVFTRWRARIKNRPT